MVGCERLNATLDGVDKDTAEITQENNTAEPAETQPEESNTLTGGLVADIEPEEPQSTTHIVMMTADGFGPDKLHIKVGDTVVWKNVRSGTINKAMIIGVRECSKVRSGFFKPGESFSWTFDEPVTCTIADGIMTTKESKIFVE
jgi:plastocyanin